MKLSNRIKEFLLILFLFVLLPNTGYSFTVDSQHPRVFITPNNIETLKARSGVANTTNPQYNTHQNEYSMVRQTADEYSASQIRSFDGLNKGRMSLANAFVYMMEGGSSYYDKGKVLLDQISSLGSDDKSHYGFMAACIIYDWFYNDLTATERTNYTNDIVQYVRGSIGYTDYSSFDPYYNDRKYPSSVLALSGQAIYNEDPTNGAEFINRSISVFNRMMLAQREIAEDGFIYPIGGVSYSDESGWQPVLRVLAGLKLAGVSGPEIDAIDHVAISKTAYGEIYALIRDNYVASHDDAFNSGDKPWRGVRAPEGPFYSAILATLHEGSEIGRITNYLQSNYSRRNISEYTYTYLGSILFNNKMANAVGSTINDLALTKVFDDTVLVYRSGWGGLSSNSNDIIFNFLAQKHANGHTHFSKGHFDIWRGYDPLTFRSGNYAATSSAHYNYFRDSLAANVMLIHNPSESTGSAPGDGGQLTNRGEGDAIGMHNSAAWRQIGHTDEGGNTYTGRIKRSAIGDNYFYSYFHYPSAYSASKVNDISRTAVRLGDYFFILDRVDGTNANYAKKWLLHSIGTPTIMDSGSWNGGTALDNNGGTPNQTSNNAKLLQVSEGNSSLFIKSIFPLNSIIHRVGGSASYRWYSYVDNYNYSDAAPTNGNYGNWRIEIESDMGSEDDVFLTLLHPTSSSGSIASTARLSGINYVGVQVDAPNTYAAIFSNNVNESTKQAGYSFQIDSQNTTRVLVCDLLAGTYDINLNGSLLSTVGVTDENGTIYIDVPSGGLFNIVRTDELKKPKPPTPTQ